MASWLCTVQNYLGQSVPFRGKSTALPIRISFVLHTNFTPQPILLSYIIDYSDIKAGTSVFFHHSLDDPFVRATGCCSNTGETVDCCSISIEILDYYLAISKQLTYIYLHLQTCPRAAVAFLLINVFLYNK